MTNITKIPQFALIDYTYAGMSEIMQQLMTDRQLSATDMEIVLDRLINDIRKKKEIEYSTAIIELTAKVQQYEKEVNNNEEVQSSDQSV